MRFWASAADQKTLPKSLGERLALLDCEGPWQHRRQSLTRLAEAGVRRLRPGTSFALGLGISCIAGGVALLGLLLLQPEPAEPMRPDTVSPRLAGPPQLVMPPARVRGTRPEDGRLPEFELTLHRGERGEALFPVRLVGVDDADNISIVLRGLPATATLSRGRQQDRHTWVLRLADLDGLQITLGKNTPDTFDVTIEATAKSGAQLAKTIAHVRLADAKAQPPFRASVVDTPFRTEVVPSTRVTTETRAVPPMPAAPGADALASPAPRRPFAAEGFSALGGPVNGQPPPVPNRLLWWKVPPPAWAPFDAQQQ